MNARKELSALGVGRFPLMGLGSRMCPLPLLRKRGSSHTRGRAWGSQVLMPEPLAPPRFTRLKPWNPTVAWPQVRRGVSGLPPSKS